MNKKLYTFFITIFITISSFSQVPAKMSYQAVVRDSGDNLLTNQLIGIRISILQNSASGIPVYVETQTPTTNINGLVSFEIGGSSALVVSGTFSTIDWALGTYFIKTETDPSGGNNYNITGTSQLMSVPYALHSKTAENIFSGDYNDLSNTPNYEIAISAIVDEQITQNSVIALNTAKTGITAQQAADITANNLKVSDINHVATSSTTDLAEGSNLYYTEARVAANTDVVANTAKTGITTQQAADITTNNLKVSDINHVTTSSTTDLAEGSNLYYTETRADARITLQKGTANGLATLDANGKIPASQVSICDLSIGDTYKGGIIFYLDPSGCHGLISAPESQETTAQWYEGSYVETKAYNSGLFDGAINTARIIRYQGNTASAAAVCVNYRGGGFTDWYLPSVYELQLIYFNIGPGNRLGLGNIGGFTTTFYWSSTELELNFVWRLDFKISGGIYGRTANNKSNNYRVRAVRAF